MPNVLMNYSIDATLLSCVHESFDQQPVQTIALCMWPLFREMSRALCCLDQLLTASDADVFAFKQPYSKKSNADKMNKFSPVLVASAYQLKCVTIAPQKGAQGNAEKVFKGLWRT